MKEYNKITQTNVRFFRDEGEKGMEEVRMYCPNCGQKLSGYADDSGVFRRTCIRCRAVIFSKKNMRKKREISIKLIEQS